MVPKDAGPDVGCTWDPIADPRLHPSNAIIQLSKMPRGSAPGASSVTSVDGVPNTSRHARRASRLSFWQERPDSNRRSRFWRPGGWPLTPRAFDRSGVADGIRIRKWEVHSLLLSPSSLSHTATIESSGPCRRSHVVVYRAHGRAPHVPNWSRRQASNLRLPLYRSGALPTELHRRTLRTRRPVRASG